MSPSSNTITENFDKIYAEGYEEGYAEAKNDMENKMKKLKIENDSMYRLCEEEEDSHSKTLNNIEETFNFTEHRKKQAELHANKFNNAKSVKGHYRTLIGDWYLLCINEDIKELKKEIEDHDSDNDVLIGNIEKLMKERSDNFLSSSLKMAELKKELQVKQPRKAEMTKIYKENMELIRNHMNLKEEITSILTKPSKIGYVQKIKNVLKVVNGDIIKREEEKVVEDEIWFADDYEESDDWNHAYGNNIEEGEYVIVMAGGGSHWWKYVINKSGVFIRSKDGQHAIKGKLVSSPQGNYLCEKEEEYVLKEGETDMYDMITECYEEEIMDYVEEEDEDDCYGECMKCDCKLYDGEGEYCDGGSCDLCSDCYEKHYDKCEYCNKGE